LPAINPAARQGYIDRYLRFFPPACLAGMRVGFYQHSSVARDLLGDIVQALCAEVIALGRTNEFVPIDTEAVSEMDILQGREWASSHGFDGIFSTDGDADRPLIGDEAGNWLRGDIVGTLCALYLQAGAVVTPMSSNTALEKCGAFGRVLRTRIGSPYVIEGMEKLLAAGELNVVGFEANGGFLLGSSVPALRAGGEALAPLPTRDAVLPILALLAMARQRGVRLSELAGDLPARFTASARLQDFAAEASRDLLRRLAGSNAALGELWGSEFARPAGIDQTDGLRITLENGDIVHLRPSGNAPELRCYTEADSPQRAEERVRVCLRAVAASARGG
jgi:phosphomannomutase